MFITLKEHLLNSQMDLKTKLCIRDSLYRLARSAQQRHHYANLAGGPGDVRNFMTAGTNEYALLFYFLTSIYHIGRI